jgi:hypothetical protein
VQVFGRRPPERVDSSSLPASENLHKSGNGHPASTYQLVGGHEQTGQLGQCYQVNEVSYMSPKAGADKTWVPKVSLVTAVAGLGCGVGYYK